LSVFVVAAIVGCGGSEDSTPADPAAEGSSQASSGNPAAAIGAFLEAIRVGNDATAARMFTPQARQKVAEMDIQVAPKGSDTASFSVGEVEFLADDGARVAATWTDLDENGKPRTEEMIWMVRRVPEGWRVAGMATVVFPGEPPLLLDFEKPEELLLKLRRVREEVARRAQTDTLRAAKPQNPQDSIRQ
jgi:hypothetical protein